MALVPADARNHVGGWNRSLEEDAVHSRERGWLDGLCRLGSAPGFGASSRIRTAVVERGARGTVDSDRSRGAPIALAAAKLVPDHYREVADRRIQHVDKTLAAVHERLSKEIDFWSDRWIKLKEDKEAGKEVRLNLENACRQVTDLEARLENRKKELQAMRHITNGTPVVLGGALVVPSGLMRELRGDEPADPVAATFAIDPAARSRIERLAMEAVAAPRKRRAVASTMSPKKNAVGISRPILHRSMANSPLRDTLKSKAGSGEQPRSQSRATKCFMPSTRDPNSC